MEWILIINGITPYIYLGIVAFAANEGTGSSDDILGVLAIVFAVQLLATIILTTVIPEEICTIKLIAGKKIPAWKFILYLIGNCIYCVDIVFGVLVHREFKKISKSTAPNA